MLTLTSFDTDIQRLDTRFCQKAKKKMKRVEQATERASERRVEWLAQCSGKNQETEPNVLF